MAVRNRFGMKSTPVNGLMPAPTVRTLQPSSQTGFQGQYGMDPNAFAKQYGNQAGQIAQNVASGKQALLPRLGVTNPADLNPFLGKRGNVAVDPFTGKPIDQEDRVSPMQFAGHQIMNNLALGPNVQKAMNFQFEGLPQSNVPQLTQGITGAAQGLLGQSGGLMGQGGGMMNNAAQSLLAGSNRILGAADTAVSDKEAAQAELAKLQRQALSPELDRGQRELFQNMADQRRAEIMSRFDEGGDVAGLFGRQRNADVANLAAKGVLDSTTASNTMGYRDTQFGELANKLLGDAAEQSRQDFLGERNKVRDVAGQFGGLQSYQASNAANLLGDLLKTNVSAGGALGSLGQGQSDVGLKAAQLGLGGLESAGQLGMAGRGQEADLQQAQLSTQLMGNQLGLQNWQSLLNERLNRLLTKEQLEQLQNPSSGLLGGILGGGASGAMAGASLGPWGALGGGILGGLGGAFR